MTRAIFCCWHTLWYDHMFKNHETLRKRSVPKWTFTQINRLILAAAPWCHQVDCFRTTQLIVNWQVNLELEHGWPAYLGNCSFYSLHSYFLNVWWILIIASLKLLEILVFNFCLISLRKFLMKLSWHTISYVVTFYFTIFWEKIRSSWFLGKLLNTNSIS